MLRPTWSDDAFSSVWAKSKWYAFSGPTCFLPMIPVNKAYELFRSALHNTFYELYSPVLIPFFPKILGNVSILLNESKWCTPWCSPYIPFWWLGCPDSRAARLLKGIMSRNEYKNLKFSFNKYKKYICCSNINAGKVLNFCQIKYILLKINHRNIKFYCKCTLTEHSILCRPCLSQIIF